MIDASWLSKLACPNCLERAGCAQCSAEVRGPERDVARYRARVACPCGGPDKVALEHRGEGLLCPTCLTRYRFGPNRDFVDLQPREDVGRVSHYADEEFQERLAVRDGEPLLSAGVKARLASTMLGLVRGESLIDLGSGAGKFATSFAEKGARVLGVDMAPFFLERATKTVSLVVGDLRRLPLRKGVTAKAYTLDVLEHVDETGVIEILVEARRALEPRGRLFVYTHAMESSRLASFQRASNRFAKFLGRLGLVDLEAEAMRKADHVNAIRSHEHFEAMAGEAGLRVVERIYYNVVFKAVVEDLALKIVQHAQNRKAARSLRSASAREPNARDAVRGHIVGRGGPSPAARLIGRVLTEVLMADVHLFGRIRTGPFFARLEPKT
jgi:ubiquinone/menaquinone biosynthesis C-methylase UbiE